MTVIVLPHYSSSKEKKICRDMADRMKFDVKFADGFEIIKICAHTSVECPIIRAKIVKNYCLTPR